MKKLTLLSLLMSAVFVSYGQDFDKNYDEETKSPIINVGLGIGLDYGGIGGRIQCVPIKQIGIYAGLGYALIGFGYNIGAQLRALPDKRVCPVFGLMYGYNGVIKVQGYEKYNKLYYGASISGGIELHNKRNSNFFNFELVIPFRSKTFYDDWDTVKHLPNIEVKSEPLPVAISIGYHFALE